MSQQIDWLQDLLAGDYSSLSTNEIYRLFYDSVLNNCEDELITKIVDDLVQFANISGSQGDFSDSLLRIYQTIGIVTRFICILSQIGINPDIMKQFHEALFSSEDVFGYFDKWQSSLAISLPGLESYDKYSPIVKCILSPNFPKQKRESFFETIENASCAFCVEASFSILSNAQLQGNIIAYIGAVQTVIDHESKMWQSLFPSLCAKLRKDAIEILIDSVIPKVFQTVEAKKLLSTAFFDDVSNIERINEFGDLFLSSAPLLSLLKDSIYDRCIQLACEIESKLKPQSAISITLANEVITDILAIFKRLELIEFTKIGSSAEIKQCLNEIRLMIPSQPDIRFDECAARAIGRSIENAYTFPDKIVQHGAIIRSIGKMLQYSSNKLEFLTRHDILMLMRLCKFGGQQYRLENLVISLIDSFLPPSFSTQFDEMKEEFKNSESINEEWQKKSSFLNVFILNVSKAEGIKTVLKVNLTPELEKAKSDFTQFFNQMNGKKKIKLQWIYEDNTVTMEAKFGSQTYTLTSPLFFADMLLFVLQEKTVTVTRLSELTGLSSQYIKALVKKGIQKEAPFLLVSDQQIGDDCSISINSDFSAKSKKISVSLSEDSFSLKMAQKKKFQATMASKKDEIYSQLILNVLKGNPSVDVALLGDQICNDLSSIFQFNDGDYKRNLASMEANGIVKLSGQSPRIVCLLAKKKGALPNLL